jgi:L-lactate dehydrogenase complex protein LldG
MRFGRRKPPDARTEVLARIRAALDGSAEPPTGRPVDRPLAGSRPTGARPTRLAPPPRNYRTAGERRPGAPELLELLVERLVDYRAVVHQADGPDDVPETLARVLAGARSAVIPSWLDATWITAASAAGVKLLTDDPSIPLQEEVLDGVDLVLTAARVAIAETGTIVLDAAADQGRRAITLLPDRHVCVVRAGQVVQTVPEAIRVLELAPTRPQTWISGPSATSDIELTRVEGVHGPRNLEVVLVRS